MTNIDGAARGGQTTNSFVRLVNELGVMRLSMIAAVSGAVVLGVVYMSGELTKPPMGLLYANLDYNDAATITDQLEQEGTAFELRGDGSAIFVDQSRVLELRMRFASEGLPAGQEVGYEIFDDQSAFGQTNFTLNLNRQRALEGELGRTIRAISKIEQARVHLAIPEHELFEREKKEPTASIVLKTRGTLDQETVAAIQHLVASAVEGLTPSNVSIVDERGTLLATGNRSPEEVIASAGLEDRQAAYEERLRDRILDIVSKYTGSGNAQVQVAAELDFNRVTEQSTIFDPDAQVVATTTTIEENESSADREASSQGVTVANSLPDNQNPANTAPGGQSNSNRSRTEEEVSYQNSQTVRTEVREAGKVTRLSVAVLVDGSYATDDQGTRTYKPREQAELDQIRELVKAGIGFNEERGDQLTVANLPFAQMDVPPGEEAKAPFLGLTKADYIYIGQIGVLFVLGIVILLFVVRPLITRLLRGGEVAAGQLSPQQLALASPAQQQAMIAEAQAKGTPLPQLTRAPSVGSQIDLAQIEGQVKESSVKKVGEVVANHPEESVAILRNWMQQTD